MSKSPARKKRSEVIIDMRRVREKTVPCWLVWSLQTTGLTQLRAICTTSGSAVGRVKMCRQERGVIRAWVEERDMDHLYGHADITELQIVNRTELHRLAAKLPLEKKDKR